MCRAQELKDSIKTTPGGDWRLPGNPPLYGCLTSPPRRDHLHHESRLDGIADVMPRQRSQLLCRAIHFNGNQISSAAKYLAKSYISPRRFMSRALLTVSANKRSAHRVIVARRVPRAGDPGQAVEKKQKPNMRTLRFRRRAPTASGDAVQNIQFWTAFCFCSKMKKSNSTSTLKILPLSKSNVWVCCEFSLGSRALCQHGQQLKLSEQIGIFFNKKYFLL